MSRKQQKKKAGAEAAGLERPDLLSRADAVEDIIRQYVEDTIRGVEHQVISRDSEGLTEVNYPLLMDFSRDGGIEAVSMRAVVWGKTLEYFENRPENFEMAIVEAADGNYMLRLRWKKSIDPALVRFYSAKVDQYTKG